MIKRKLHQNFVVESEDVLDILRRFDPQTLAVYIVVLSYNGEEPITVDELADYCGFTREETEKYIYQLSLCYFGIFDGVVR